MRKKAFILLLAVLLTTMAAWAQTSDNDSVPYYGLWDPEREVYWIPDNGRHDTISNCFALGTRGDVLTGYNITGKDVEGWAGAGLHRFYLYQADENKQPLKQIVLTTEKWDIPCMATLYPEVLGYKFRAVNEREYAALDSADMILGEAFQCVTVGDPYTTFMPLEIVVFPREHVDSEDESLGYELVHFQDTTGIYYMSVGKNNVTRMAEYSPWQSDGRYNTQFFVFDNESGEVEEWMERTRRILGGRDPGEPGEVPTRANPIRATQP